MNVNVYLCVHEIILLRYFMVFKTIRFAFLLFSAVFFVSCGKNDAGTNAARLRVKFTDATSFVIKELYIDIQSIEVSTTDAEGDVDEWIPLEFTPAEFNVLTLRNGVSVQVVDQFFPAHRTIHRMRIKLGNNNHFVTTTTAVHPLVLSEEVAQGVIIENVNVNLYAHIISYVVIDFNAAFSIRELNGNYFLNPSVRVFDETLRGSLRGYVAPVEANATVAVANETDTLFTIPEPDGMFMFTGLDEGNWDVHVLAQAESGFRDTVFTETVTKGSVKDVQPRPIRLLTAE